MSATVGIMTMQRIHNYGSSLQAFGLRRLIESLVDDVDVSFVDYVPGRVLVIETPSSIPSSGFRRALSKVVQYNEVDARFADKLRFFNHKRTYAKRYLPLIGVPVEPQRDLDLDVQVIGSDEVFNCVQSNSNVGYSRDLFGHGSPARKLISYAGSFGNTTIDKIDAFGIGPDLAEDFARFSEVSVRDANSARIVEHLTGRTPGVHVDPVLAYDFMNVEPRIPPERQYKGGRYLIVYGYSGRLSDEENRILASYARRSGVDVLCFGGVQGCCDRFIDCGPFELLAYFRDAEAVITDTFHGTILAMINRKPFGSIIRRSVERGYGNEEKLGFLLDTFGLASQKLTDLSQISEVLAHEIDYDAVDVVLRKERDRTHEYLRRAIP